MTKWMKMIIYWWIDDISVTDLRLNRIREIVQGKSSEWNAQQLSTACRKIKIQNSFVSWSSCRANITFRGSHRFRSYKRIDIKSYNNIEQQNINKTSDHTPLRYHALKKQKYSYALKGTHEQKFGTNRLAKAYSSKYMLVGRRAKRRQDDATYVGESMRPVRLTI